MGTLEGFKEWVRIGEELVGQGMCGLENREAGGGVGAVKVKADLLAMLASHPGTSQDLAKFDEKWEKRFGKGISELL